MSESAFWTNQVAKLKNFGKAERIENVIGLGTPDVSYCLRWLKEPAVTGWIELKYLPKWPARTNSIVRFKHYTLEQADFLRDWSAAGCRACMLAQIGGEFLLIPGAGCKDVYNGLTRTGMAERAAVHAAGQFPLNKVLRWLTKT